MHITRGSKHPLFQELFRDEASDALVPLRYIAQWLERLTADQQVPGANPGVPFDYYGTII